MTLIVSLVVVIVLLGCAWWLWAAARDNYFIAVGEDDALMVENGVNFSVFGHDLHSPYQNVCLGDDGAVRTVDLDSSGDCSPFTLTDLPEAARNGVDAWASGSYDDVSQQLQRLGEEALPLCLSTAEEGEATSETARPSQHGRTTPGVNCRAPQNNKEGAHATEASSGAASDTEGTAPPHASQTASQREEAQ